MFALKFYYLSLLSKLIVKKKAVDSDGRSLVHLAGIFKNETALDFAIFRNVKIDERDFKGRRALDYAMTRWGEKERKIQLNHAITDVKTPIKFIHY